MRSLGICVGASNIKIVTIENTFDDFVLKNAKIINHNSNPKEALQSFLNSIDNESYDFFSITGRKIRAQLQLTSITEAEAVENALELIRIMGDKKEYDAVASLGAENFIIYFIDKNGYITHIETGNKCASGTGDFFLQQIRRMDIGIDEAVHLASESEIFKVSGRCSVFCKSDCTHALNKGIPIGRVCAGLCLMIAEKIVDLIGKFKTSSILVTGGVTRNLSVMKFLSNRIPDLSIHKYSSYFEAIGAAFYAFKNKSEFSFDTNNIFVNKKSSFSELPPIVSGLPLVRFEPFIKADITDGDECIVGLDVGSTTTKAILIRASDCKILSSVYLRTNGNPIKASRDCYDALEKKIKIKYSVIGIGTTGSGRQIAALHAQTNAVINEIIAHATAAAFYDDEVDTIIEIGGQDAKYTHLVNGVPADYAMNEACSAGTGSFLEESARENFGIDVKNIQDIALTATSPANFNDQCAAFISSDIKTATHECIERENIIAGLVYSICMNYVNRVKGQRSLGKKIFMQGGVCYNRAVPLAMATLIEKNIVVPPEPGLMGAFGVALETKYKIDKNEISKKNFDLHSLANREIIYDGTFICSGGKDKCDRKCEISTLTINNKKYPFGGACNKYYNIKGSINSNTSQYNWVKSRNDLLFSEYAAKNCDKSLPKIGITRSFLTNMFFPLYSHFFLSLGFNPVLSDTVQKDGIKYKRTSFCYPGEIAHGFFYDLLLKKPDFIFLPKVRELYVENAQNKKPEHQSTCLLLQSEAYFLKSAFKTIENQPRIISPQLDFSLGFENQQNVYIEIGLQLGRTKHESRNAYNIAVEKQKAFTVALREKWKELLSSIDNNKSQTVIVLFGRPYNAFADEANMNIPAKFSSRGVNIVPWDILPLENETIHFDMCWAIGQNLMKAAAFVQKTTNLFGVYITNFSCGPDSFLIGYFREIMGSKPSLTLELDSHTADAGVNTRIEAFLDIVAKYRQNNTQAPIIHNFTAASINFNKNHIVYRSSDGHNVPLSDSNIHLLFPSMGKLCSELLAATFESEGIHSSAIPVYTMDVLKKGRSVSSCKECLPLLLTTGGLLEYLSKRETKDEYFVYFMPTTPGNCRFTQYRVFLENLIQKNKLENIALLSLTNENGYAGLPVRCMTSALKAIIVADIMEDIKNALLVLSVNKDDAMTEFNIQWQIIVNTFKNSQVSDLFAILQQISNVLKLIPLKHHISYAKKVGILGEIFVRREYFSCQDLIERLANNDIIAKRAHTLEWFNYCDWNVENGIYQADFSISDWLKFKLKRVLSNKYERKIKSILAQSGLYEDERVDIDTIMAYGKNFFDVQLTGEAILVVGDFFKDIINSLHGVISIGPFGCMPTRIIDAILSAEATMDTKIKLDQKLNIFPTNIHTQSLPFLTIESDGNPFPQIIEARIEAFCLQVDRLWKQCNKNNLTSYKNANLDFLPSP